MRSDFSLNNVQMLVKNTEYLFSVMMTDDRFQFVSSADTINITRVYLKKGMSLCLAQLTASCSMA